MEAAAGAPNDLGLACHRLRVTAGGLRIADLADELGYRRKRLSARFAGWMGVTPKTYARVLRFRAAAFDMERGDLSSDDDGTPHLATVRLGAYTVYLSRSHPGSLEPPTEGKVALSLRPKIPVP